MDLGRLPRLVVKCVFLDVAAARSDGCAVSISGRRSEIVMSLRETLDALRTAMTEEATAAYAEILERFDSQMLGRRALKIGDRMPEFVLPNAEGKLVSSAQLLSKHSLIINFYRGSWCPYCSVTLKALDSWVKTQSERIPLALVAISPETGGRASEFKAINELECEVLVDVDNAIAVQFGVVIRLPKRYQTLLLGRGIDPKTLHGGEGWLIPLASTFVVSTGGQIVHSELHVDHTRRTEMETIPPVIERLSSSV
jgi:peroxiredoxin